MRCAILADIHANLAALIAVLNDIKTKGAVDEIWCLGDIVGYGPDPAECIKLLRKLKAVCVAGNHDLGAVGKIELSYFNPVAAEACEWTAEQLNAADALYLEDCLKPFRGATFCWCTAAPPPTSLNMSSPPASPPRTSRFLIRVIAWWAIPMCRWRSGRKKAK